MRVCILDIKYSYETWLVRNMLINKIWTAIRYRECRQKHNAYRCLKEKQVKTFNGLNMFIYQGQKSFYMWNKINPEIDDRLIDLLISKLR